MLNFGFCFTTAAVASLSERFGALTIAGHGGIAVTGASIASGDASGHWQITGGYLVPSSAGDTANLNLGPYSLVLNDGQLVSIEIDANAWDVRTQGDWDTVILQSTATLSGKTIYCRPGSVFVSGVHGNVGSPLRRGDWGGLTIRSRNLSNKAEFDKFELRGTRNVSFIGLTFTRGNRSKFIIIGEVANNAGEITIDQCELYGEAFDPHYDFTSAPYPNDDMIFTNAATQEYLFDLTITNNYIEWCSRGMNVYCIGTLITSGNRIKYFYDDGINAVYPNANAPWWCEDNVISHPMGKGTDNISPHVDGIRGLASNTASTDWEVHINRNRVWGGDARGDLQCCLLSDFKSSGVDSGHFYTGEAKGNVFVKDTTHSLSVENAMSFHVEGNTCVSHSLPSGTTIAIAVGFGSLDSTTSGTHTISRNITEGMAYVGSPDLTDNVILGQGGVDIPYTTAMNGPTWAPETLEELMAWFSRKASGPADLGTVPDAGAIGSGFVNWASTVPGSDGSFN